MIKFLIFGTLVMGSLVLLANIFPVSRHNVRSRGRSKKSIRQLNIAAAFAGRGDDPKKSNYPAGQNQKVRKTEDQWKTELTEEQYQVTRCGATERPFTGKFWNHREDGTYHCVGCSQELFSSSEKYDSGTGWASYTQPVNSKSIDEIADISYGVVRTEIVCSRCEAHLGHVFADGPRPAGLRYCINSASLEFSGAAPVVSPTSRPTPARIASGE